MMIFEYSAKTHKPIILACVRALQQGKIIAYPTDTCYGLAVDSTNIKAVKRLYKTKGRDFKKPIHLVVPSLVYAKKIVKWNAVATKLAKKFWPGALTLVLPVGNGFKPFPRRQLSAGTNFLGLRMPKNKIALDLAKKLEYPITATSANRSGKLDCYNTNDIINQFKLSKYKPDIIINIGKLPFNKPSTLVKVNGNKVEILRNGPISRIQIFKALSTKGLGLRYEYKNL